MGQKNRLPVHPEDFWISPKYRASDWMTLQLRDGTETDWLKAVDIVEDRIRNRFVRWIDSIEGSKFSGFAVIALDCLLIEALVGFLTGKSSGGPDHLLTGALTNGEFRFTEPEAEDFRKHVRNGIIHDSETRAGWIIRPGHPDGQVLTKTGKGTSLNRNAFHRALKHELDTWLARLRNGDKKLRDNMKNRMTEIIEKHGEAT